MDEFYIIGQEEDDRAEEKGAAAAEAAAEKTSPRAAVPEREAASRTEPAKTEALFGEPYPYRETIFDDPEDFSDPEEEGSGDPAAYGASGPARPDAAARSKAEHASDHAADSQYEHTHHEHTHHEHSQPQKSRARRILSRIGRYAARTAVCIVSFLLVILIGLLSAIYMIEKGPSSIVREMFVDAMVQTGAMDFCAYLFLSDAEVAAILEKTEIIVPPGKTDTQLVVVGDGEHNSGVGEIDDSKGIVYNEQGVALLDLKGKTYVGKILIVKDPSRVSVCGLDQYGEGIVGKTTEQMAKETHALAAINAGGYEEMSDYKTGGIPLGRDEGGIVILDGVLKWGELDRTYEVIGFDRNDILHVDNMTAREALDIGIRDAVNWGPVLVKNGEPCVVPSESVNPGFHPRSAIGQRADGSVILLVIDGRQAHSLGASYDDLVEVMVEYGAVNAANLDGGMSSYMVYEDEVITSPYMLYFNGRRTVSTSFIVSRLGE